MTQVVFKRTGGAAVTFVVRLEKKNLKFDGQGQAIVHVNSGAYYGLSWFVSGPANAPWSLELTTPAAVKFKIAKSLPPDGKDNNSEWLYVP